MSEYDEFDDDFEGNEESGNDLPAPARKRLRELEKELKALKKERDESLKSLSGFRLRDVLAARGISDKRAGKYLAKDGVDLSDEQAVDAWLAENGDMFGYSPASESQNDETEEAYRAISAAEERGIPTSSQAEILAKFQNAQSLEELDALRVQYGNIKA